MKDKFNLRFGLLALMVLLAALSRLLPHPPNFSPVGAIALFGGTYFSRRWTAFVIPALSLWLSDLILNNVVYREYYPEFTLNPGTLLTTYLPFALIVGLGFLLLKRVTFTNALAASLSASVLFFLVSNFFVWYGSVRFPHNALGLFLCYEFALPFFWNTLLGDLFFVGVLFGAFEWVKRQYPSMLAA